MIGNDDAKRTAILQRLSILDSDPEPAFDAVARLAQATFKTSSVLISFMDVDRQWFKARIGFGPSETERRIALCHYTLQDPSNSTVVSDARLDKRFWNNPLVTGEPFIRFYAATPLIVENVAVGTLCLLGAKPHWDFGPDQMLELESTAAVVEELLRLRLETGERRAKEQALEISGRRLLLAEELAGIGHWTLEPATGRVTWTEQVYRIHGLDPTEFDPSLNDALEFYEDDSRSLVAGHIQRAIATGEGFAFKAKLVRVSDGSVRTVLAKAEMSREGGESILFGVFQDVTDQDLLLHQVRADGERYRLLTQNATDVIATYTADGTFTYLSPSIQALVGRPAAELVGRKTYEIIHPDDHKRVTGEFRALVQSHAPSARVEYRALRSEGEPIWVEAHPTPTFDAAGRLTGFQDVVRDVSARRAAETAARESERRYRLLAENANDMIALTSTKDSKILYVSPGCRRVLGYAPEELVGRGTLSLTHPDDRAHVVELFTGLLAAGRTEAPSPYRFRGLRQDGSWAWLEGQPRVHFDESGAPSHFQDLVRDITQRKAAEDAAQAAAQVSDRLRAAATDSEQRYRLLAENATDMIARYGLDGAISFVSPACLPVMGYSSEELIGTKTIDFIHPDDLMRIRQEFADYVASGSLTAMRTRHRIYRKDGRVVWLEGRPLLVRTADGQPKEFYDVMRDVTDRVELEEDLLAAKLAAEAAVQAKSDFLANMSHELRTPLTGILGYADVLAQTQDLSPVSQRYAKLIAQSGRNLLGLVNDVLDLSKLEASGAELDPQPMELARFLADTLDLVRPQAEAKGLVLRLDLVQGPIGVEADEARLRQVVLNLLGNAIKFTETGTVRLELWVGEPALGGRKVQIAVTDSGIGIEAHQLAQVFGRFEQADASITRRFGGTGLGLSISRAIVQQMGGALRVESQVGVGSTFTLDLDLPAADLVADRQVSSPAVIEAALDGLRILLAEDVFINRELIDLFLAKDGMVLTSVENGAEAVEVAARERFDLVLMDMQMPVLDGLEATRLIRASDGHNARIPILALTANVMPDEITKCLDAGMNGHVGKPFTAESLKSAIRAALIEVSIG